ncbi:MAG: aminodeoxychorismate/anthranilate synthase component II [Saprospiraceae bacterium]|nr:aminodeoxychorismate/anthranilate synthase component II [Saprospiraceae bacterium]
MQLLILDNYDSFTYNLMQYFQQLIPVDHVQVFRNDKISLDEVGEYDAIVLSPGPGLPKDAGIMPELIKRYAGSIPIFGVCLGEQAIAEAFGGTLYNLDRVYHGVETPIHITDTEESIFAGLSNPFQAGRYHSWAVTKEELPEDLIITAEDDQGVIMALRHKTFDVCGVQFHPESIMTNSGLKILENWIESIKEKTPA